MKNAFDKSIYAKSTCIRDAYTQALALFKSQK